MGIAPKENHIKCSRCKPIVVRFIHAYILIIPQTNKQQKTKQNKKPPTPNSDFDDPGTHPTDGRAEIQIAFSGTGESQEYTRAIASSENKIEQLHLSLCTPLPKRAPSITSKTWTEGTDYDPVNPGNTNFRFRIPVLPRKASSIPMNSKGSPG